jgi:V/A-type H+/Na+-transporting ATPase subunit I
MIADMAKIQIAVPAKQREHLLQWLQEEELVHIIDTPHAPPALASQSDTTYQLARVQFALEFVKRVQTELKAVPKKSIRHLFSGKPIAKLAQLEQTLQTAQIDQLVEDAQRLSNKLSQLTSQQQSASAQIAQLDPWQALHMTANDQHITTSTEQYLLAFDARQSNSINAILRKIPTAAWQEVHHHTESKTTYVYGELVVHRRHNSQLQTLLQATAIEVVELNLDGNQTIAERIQRLQQEMTELARQYQHTLQSAHHMLSQEQDLQFAYDGLLHRQEREAVDQRMAHLAHIALLTGWIPKSWLADLKARLAQYYPATVLESVPAEDSERPPVALINRPAIKPFESVTSIYGQPAHNELDPSSALALFFLISFGLALTDAGYGLVMMAATWAAERFFRLKRTMRKMVRLLFYAGAVTTIIGALTGGWFGITLENLPDNLVRDVLLGMKIIDPISQLLTLLAIALAIGVVQLLFAWIVRAYHHWQTNQKSAIWLDDIPWITIIAFILLWAAARQEILMSSGLAVFKWLAIANAIYLVFTQGRHHKNPLLKLGSGIMSLYGLVSFLSDTLSYSRLLALGLATGIIGLVVNLIASMVTASVPVVGFFLAAIVLIIGHTFNLGINVLGAFIHSGRLQFVEFFPKFMAGGGTPFKPLGRVSKYVDNPKEFVYP